MLGFLFRRLTAQRHSGDELFELATAVARRPHWFIEGQLPDTLDGRFAVLATITAIMMARLEAEGEPGIAASVGLTERFIDVMESEHRELGLGDPSLGKTVRKLVAMLARRTELWRQARSGGINWTEATRDSLYGGSIGSDALLDSAEALRQFNEQLSAASLTDIEQGRLA